MGKLRPFVRKDSYMPNKKWIPFVIGNGYTTTDGASGPAHEYETVTGNPVSFNAITPFPLRKLEVAFSPVQEGSGDPSPDNVRPISGWSSLTISQSGANLVVETADWVRKNNPSIVLPSTIANGVWTLTNADAVGRTVILPCGTLKAGSYAVALTAVSSGSVSLMVSGTSTRLALLSENQPVRQFTLSEDTEVNFEVTVYSNTTLTIENLMLNLGNEAKPYQPYNPLSRSISISLGQTTYSGYADVVTGVGEITGGIFADAGTAGWNMAADFYIGEEYSRVYTNTGLRKNAQSWSMMNWLKKIYSSENANGYWYDGARNLQIRLANSLTGIVYGEDTRQTAVAKFKAYFAEHPIQFVYELATPIPIQLTTQEVESLAGDNTMWTDGDSLTVEYRSN